jgi:hypothetical protein
MKPLPRLDVAIVSLAAAMVVALGVMAYAVLVLRPSDSPTSLVLATTTATPGAPTQTQLPLGPTAVPWVDSTEGPTPTPSPPPSYSYPDVRPCVAADLAGSRGEGQGINAGEAEAGIVFTNVSSTVCKLEGVPTIQFVGQDGATELASWRKLPCLPVSSGCESLTALLETDHGQTPAPNYFVRPSQTSVLVTYSTGSFDAPSSTPCPNMAKAILITLPDGGGSLNLPLMFGTPADFQPLVSFNPLQRLRPRAV